MELKISSLQQKHIEDKDNDNRINIDMVHMNAAPDCNNSMNIELTPIRENEVTLTVPDDPKWSSLPLHRSKSYKSEEAKIDLDTLTKSDVSTAMTALEFTGAPDPSLPHRIFHK